MNDEQGTYAKDDPTDHLSRYPGPQNSELKHTNNNKKRQFTKIFYQMIEA
jgi:hypothetical protein